MVSSDAANCLRRWKNGGVDGTTSSYMALCLSQHVDRDVDVVLVRASCAWRPGWGCTRRGLQGRCLQGGDLLEVGGPYNHGSIGHAAVRAASC